PITPPPPRSPLFPYTTLFRSRSSVDPTGCGPVPGGEAGCPRRPLERGCERCSTASRPVTHGSWVDCRPDVLPEETSSGWLPDRLDRKSTRLNSSHDQISYAVF